jgi:hypothetical protein
MSDGNISSLLAQTVPGRRTVGTATGVPATWASALDRFARSVHRFRDRVDEVDDRRLGQELRRVGDELYAALVAVRSRSRGAPGHRQDLGPAVRGLLRAGTLCAHATECAAAAESAARDHDTDAAARHVADVRELVRTLVAGLETDGEAPPP